MPDPLAPVERLLLDTYIPAHPDSSRGGENRGREAVRLLLAVARSVIGSGDPYGGLSADDPEAHLLAFAAGFEVGDA